MEEQTFLEKIWYGSSEHSFFEASLYRVLSTGIVGAAAYFGYKYLTRNSSGGGLNFFSGSKQPAGYIEGTRA